MNNRPYSLISGIVFLIVALAHAWRAATGSALLIGTLAVPIWASWVVAAGAATLAFWGLRSASR